MSPMPMLRTLLAGALTAATAFSMAIGPAAAQTAITIGKITGGIGLHIPSYIAMDKGFFKAVGRDYKVISLPGDPERIAALLNNDIHAAMVSSPQAVRALQAGMKIVLRTGDHLPRVGGCFWVPEEYFAKNPDTVKKFIRAIAR